MRMSRLKAEDMYSDEYLHAAHAHSMHNEPYVSISPQAGCFHCCSVFPTSHVVKWILDVHRATACCPKCGVDAVIPSNREPLVCERGFLEAMNRYWFGNE